MRSTPRFAVLALAALALPASSLAIVSTTSTTVPLGATSSYGFVGLIGGGSAVAVGPRAFLTAQHVEAGGLTSGTVLLNGTSYTISSTVAAPDYTLTDGTKSHVDLTLVYVTQNIGGYYTVPTTRLAASTAVTMVGMGGTGLLRTDGLGYDVPAKNDPNPARAALAANGTRRAANGTVNGFFVNPVDVSQTGSNGFAGGPLAYSILQGSGGAALGDGDSGGGWFVGNSLVGLSVATVATNANFSDYNFPVGSDFFGSAAIDLTDPQIRGFVTQAVPEPAPLAALAFGALAMLRRRKR